MSNIFKMLEQQSVRDAWNDVMEALVVERLKEDYLLCIDWADMDTANAILVVLRYFMVYDDFSNFLKEARDAGYANPRE
jgi:hypothetical protein